MRRLHDRRRAAHFRRVRQRRDSHIRPRWQGDPAYSVRARQFENPENVRAVCLLVYLFFTLMVLYFTTSTHRYS